MNDLEGTWVGLVSMILALSLTVITCSVGGCIHYQQDVESLRNQAVMRGFAEWKATDHGPEWKWKEKNE